jgi:16S rRNA (guanine527-N7)-methyltransferase
VDLSNLKGMIDERVAVAGLDVSPDVLQGLLTYTELLSRWNRRINLTAIDLEHPTPAGIDRLLIEPLLAAPFVPVDARVVLDVGSGGGSPALPMRLAAPHGVWLLVEARRRKSSFLREAVRVLGLRDVQVATARFEAIVEEPALTHHGDVVTVRAVRADDRLWDAVRKALDPAGRVIWFRSADSSGGTPAGCRPIEVRKSFVVLSLTDAAS